MCFKIARGPFELDSVSSDYIYALLRFFYGASYISAMEATFQRQRIKMRHHLSMYELACRFEMRALKMMIEDAIEGLLKATSFRGWRTAMEQLVSLAYREGSSSSKLRELAVKSAMDMAMDIISDAEETTRASAEVRRLGTQFPDFRQDIRNTPVIL